MEALILKNGAIQLRKIPGLSPAEDKTLVKILKQEKESLSCQTSKSQIL
jgi:hypothetical protein